MAQFSRRTILAATDILNEPTHAEIDRFALEYGLETIALGYSKMDKANAIGRYLIQHPESTNDYGENTTDAVVAALVGRAIRRSVRGFEGAFSYEAFQEHYLAVHSALARDGFTVSDGTLRRALPDNVDLPAADDQVHILLDQYGFAVPRGHLDQGIAAHARGDWAAANAQFRPFVESLFDCIAEHLAHGMQVPSAGNQRRIWLANRNPPFFLATLNEWNGDGSGFIQAFFRRLHPAGAHPGLSDEEDSTFRLHMVLLVGRLLLRRIAQV